MRKIVPEIAPDDELLTLQQAANWLRARGSRPWSREAVLLEAAHGLLPVRSFGRIHNFVRVRDLEALVDLRKRQAAQPA